MSKLPGVNHLDAVRAFEKAGFRIIRQSKHIVMSDGGHILTIPRHNPVNWKKLKGFASVRLIDGTVHTAELHWYEAHGIGKKELKI